MARTKPQIPVIMPAGFALRSTDAAPQLPAPDPKQVAQALGERYWATATSEDRETAWYKGDAYTEARGALIGAVITAYAVAPEIATRVYDLVTEYGPSDSLQGTGRGVRGIASYVEFALANDRDDYHY